MHPYVAEEFSAGEREILRRYFTNLDGPVFALVNLPEVVKGALFARYSRSPKSLRRLFLDEFAGDLDLSGDAGVDATAGMRRADELYQRIFFEYGDDSVAQLGGVHLACEQASNLLTKVLERGRLASYLEQSTRYIAYDRRLSNGHYRFYRDPGILESRLGARYVGEMDRMFDTYAEVLRSLTEHLTRRFPKTPQDTDFVYRQAIRAKALDASRGLLPASALSNVGIYASGQAYEALLLRMRAHPLEEVREYAELIRAELVKVIPSFLKRLDVPERGGEWTRYLKSTRESAQSTAAQMTGRVAVSSHTPEVTLVGYDPDGETRVLEAILFESDALSDEQTRKRVAEMNHEDRERLLGAYVGQRSNRRHRPGRALERTDYRFELVTDYGAFRDLQRHRLLTIAWQPLSADLGYDVPQLVVDAELEETYRTSLERSGELYYDLLEHSRESAQYAVALAHRIRYSIQMNAREAMHLIELRSSPQGHPSYRRVAHRMFELLRDQAGHTGITSAMSFVDFNDVDLERLEAERRAERRRHEI